MDTKYPLYTPKDIFISFCGREATEAERWQGVQSGIIFHKILFVCALACLVVGVFAMQSEGLRGYGFEAIFFLMLMFLSLSIYLRSNAKDKVKDPKALDIDIAIFRTDKAFNWGALGVIVILTILYIALW